MQARSIAVVGTTSGIEQGFPGKRIFSDKAGYDRPQTCSGLHGLAELLVEGLVGIVGRRQIIANLAPFVP